MAIHCPGLAGLASRRAALKRQRAAFRAFASEASPYAASVAAVAVHRARAITWRLQFLSKLWRLAKRIPAVRHAIERSAGPAGGGDG